MKLVRKSEASVGGAVMYVADFTLTASTVGIGNATVVTRRGSVGMLQFWANTVWLNHEAVQVTEEAGDEARA
jgi:hypothetical protein